MRASSWRKIRTGTSAWRSAESRSSTVPPPIMIEFKDILAERIRAIPRCTQMLRTQPFDVGAPQWVDDPGFDLSRHVRRVAVPRPGDDAELFRVVADVLERRLDRDRPLWECWVIEGLKGNRWAILMKIHHCMADGISATRILTRLCDDVDGDAFARPTVTKRTAATHPHLKPVPDPKPRRTSEPAGQPLADGHQHHRCGCADGRRRGRNRRRLAPTLPRARHWWGRSPRCGVIGRCASRSPTSNRYAGSST